MDRPQERFGRSENRCLGEGERELLRTVKFLRIFLAADLARDIAQRSVGRRGFDVNSILRFYIVRRCRLIFLGFDLLEIFRYKNLRALQIFIGVNVLGLFLLCFFAGAFLSGGIGDILRGTLGRANCGRS